MSDEQSAPVEPEALPRPSTDAEPGPVPGAGDTEVGPSAEFATSAGESTPPESAPTDTEAAAAPAEPTRQPMNAPAQTNGFAPESTSISTQNSATVLGMPDAPAVPGAPETLGWTGFGGPPPVSPEPAPAKPRSKALLGTGIGLGYAALAAATAFAVIAIASPGPVHGAGLAGAEASSTAATAAPSSSPSAQSAAPTTAPPTTATPTSTVTGHVSNGVHTGDLRFFLLPPPDGASSVQGDPDGTTETTDDVVSEYGGGSSVRSTLRQLGFKTACTRTYQDSNMGANVDIELLRFSGSNGSSTWFSGFALSGSGMKHISVPGVSGADGWSYKKDGEYELIGVYREGDTFFEVSIYANEPVTATDLGRVVKAEHARLANG